MMIAGFKSGQRGIAALVLITVAWLGTPAYGHAQPVMTATTNTSSSTASATNSPAKTAKSASAKKLAPGEKININTATATDLARLPGIGKSKAQAIIDYRTQNGDFKSPEDIEKVKGIKAGLFAKLKDYIEVVNP